MILVKILSFFASLLMIYPASKFIKKKDVNLFDLIIIFHSFNFCLPPLFSIEENYKYYGTVLKNETTCEIFLYYILAIGTLTIIDLIWSNTFNHLFCVINVSRYTKELYNKINSSKSVIIKCSIYAILCIVYILPNISYLFFLSDEANLQYSYQKSSMLSVLNSLLILFYSLSIILFFRQKKTGWKKTIIVISLIIYAVISFFLSRRIFLQYILLGLFIYYSIYKDKIEVKFVLKTSILLFIILVYFFPFFNLIRVYRQYANDNGWKSIKENIGQSLSATSIEMEMARNSTSDRSIGLYTTLYNYVQEKKYPLYGSGIASAVNFSLPKFFVNNKEGGSQALLEKYSGTFTDNADSLLYLFYAEFHIMGFIAFNLCIIFILFLFCFFNILLNKIFKSIYFSLYVLFTCFFMTYDIETALEAILVSLRTLIFIYPILLFIFELKISKRIIIRQYFLHNKRLG